MKFIFSFLLLLHSIFVHGQKILTVDFDNIKKQVEDARSPMYCPTLIAKFEKGDSMTQDELKCVYYGSGFSEQYDPYNSGHSADFEKYYGEQKFKEAIPYGLKVLAQDPVNLKLTFRLLICYHKLNITDSAQLFARRYYSLLDVIYNSGEGTSLEKAMVVMRVSDEYEILRDNKFRLKVQSLIQGADGGTDKMELEQEGQEQDPKIAALYFNVEMPMQQLHKLLKDKITIPGKGK